MERATGDGRRMQAVEGGAWRQWTADKKPSSGSEVACGSGNVNDVSVRGEVTVSEGGCRFGGVALFQQLQVAAEKESERRYARWEWLGGKTVNELRCGAAATDRPSGGEDMSDRGNNGSTWDREEIPRGMGTGEEGSWQGREPGARGLGGRCAGGGSDA